MDRGAMSWHRASIHQPLSVFSKTSIVILLLISVLLISLGFAVQQSVVLIVGGGLLLLVVLIMSGIRWAPVSSSIIGGLILSIFVPTNGYPLHHLTHSKDAFGYGQNVAVSFAIFTLMLIICWGAALLVVTGIAAVIHNYAQPQRRTPLWFRSALTGALGVLLGAFVLGSLAQPTPTVLASSSGPTTVHLLSGSFSQSPITLAKGSKLTLIDDGDYHHNISGGWWANGQPIMMQEAGAPKVNRLDIDAAGKSVAIGPFTTAGTYHLLCTIHHGMTLTIIVK